MISANDTKLKLLNESNRPTYTYKPPVKRSSISVINSNNAPSNTASPSPPQPPENVLSSSSVVSPTSPKSIQSMSPTSQLHTGTQSIKTSTHSINKRMSMHTISRNSVSSASKLRSRHSPSSKDPSLNRAGTAAAAATAAAQAAARETPLFEDPFYRAKQFKKQRKQDIQKRFTDIHHSHNTNANKTKSSQRSADNEYKTAQCHMTFIFDPNGRLSYWMGFIVSLAFLYNFWVIIYRYSFNEINSKNKFYWFMFDYFADFLYICDILFNFRTGFLEEGVLQTDPTRLRHYYMNTTRFYVDCLCLIPLDILYLSIGYNSILRCFRLVKIYRFWEFLDRTERHTNFPNFFRTVVMLHYLFAIFHWNACFSYFLSRYLSDELVVINRPSSVPQHPPSVHSQQQSLPLAAANAYFYANEPHKSAAIFFNNEPLNINHNSDHNNNFPSSIPVVTLSSSSSSKTSALLEESRFKYKHKPFDPYNTHVDLLKEYLKAFYMSTKIMTLVSEMPNPRTSRDYIFSIIQLIFALLLFATIMGHVGYIVSNLGNARKEFQSKLDGVKTYMSLRRVPKRLQDRVIRWFDFLWGNHKSIDDNQILNLLPYKLRAEIAIHVHLDTLKRVEIFQNTEAGFLNELVLRLKPVLYSPGDFICRKGEVGKEMYIVSAGKLQVISDDGKAVLATLKAGSYFGEISILNMGASGNRRTASVKSVGYSDLFCLSKEDLWEVLKEYPAVRVKLEAIAVRRLEKHKMPLSEIVNMKRCKSAPGLLQISLATPPVPKVLKRYGTLPATLLKRTDISLVLSNNYSASASTSNMKKKKSIQDRSNDKKADNEKVHLVSTKRQLHIQTVNESSKAPATSNEPTPTTTGSFNSSDLTLTCNTPTKATHRKTKPNDDNTTSDESYFSSGRLSTTRQHYYNEKLLADEMEKLKKYIYFLKAENLALNFKLNKYQNYRQDLDMEFEINKARPESSDIDDFKV